MWNEFRMRLCWFSIQLGLLRIYIGFDHFFVNSTLILPASAALVNSTGLQKLDPILFIHSFGFGKTLLPNSLSLSREPSRNKFQWISFISIVFHEKTWRIWYISIHKMSQHVHYRQWKYKQIVFTVLRNSSVDIAPNHLILSRLSMKIWTIFIIGLIFWRKIMGKTEFEGFELLFISLKGNLEFSINSYFICEWNTTSVTWITTGFYRKWIRRTDCNLTLSSEIHFTIAKWYSYVPSILRWYNLPHSFSSIIPAPKSSDDVADNNPLSVYFGSYHWTESNFSIHPLMPKSKGSHSGR